MPKAQDEKTCLTITVKGIPLWIVTRLRIDAAKAGETGYGKALARVLEKHYNRKEGKQNGKA